ncbi:MAG: glycosyltransferase family 4 protein [Candidatus Acidiferrales bacterium]
MRTLHVDLGPGWRGGQNQVWLLMNGLRHRGVDAEFLGREDAPLLRRAREEKFVVHSVAAGGAPIRAWVSTRWRAAWGLRKLMRVGFYDIVHAHDAHGLTAAWLAGAHRQARLVATRRVVYPLGGGLGGARYRSAHRLVAISEAVRKAMLASCVPDEKIAVVHSGVELPTLPKQEDRKRARLKFGLSEGELVLGTVGMFYPDKGQESLLRMLAVLRRKFPACRVLLAGEGPERPRLERLARELEIAPAVCFTGFVEDVAAVYAALDVFLFPAVDEGLGTALLAAMAHGLPVVALRETAASEVVDHERSGLLVADCKPETLVDAVRSLLADAQAARRLGEGARARIAERFSAEQMVEGNLKVYRELAAEERSR